MMSHKTIKVGAVDQEVKKLKMIRTSNFKWGWGLNPNLFIPYFPHDWWSLKWASQGRLHDRTWSPHTRAQLIYTYTFTDRSRCLFMKMISTADFEATKSVDFDVSKSTPGARLCNAFSVKDKKKKTHFKLFSLIICITKWNHLYKLKFKSETTTADHLNMRSFFNKQHSSHRQGNRHDKCIFRRSHRNCLLRSPSLRHETINPGRNPFSRLSFYQSMCVEGWRRYKYVHLSIYSCKWWYKWLSVHAYTIEEKSIAEHF